MTPPLLATWLLAAALAAGLRADGGIPPSAPAQPVAGGEAPTAGAAPARPGAPGEAPVATVSEVVVVTATAGPHARPDLPYAVDRLERDQVLSLGARDLPAALAALPGVTIQRTANGQASPYLRGLTGYGTLLLVDGVHLDHSAQREGPNQYWTTVDALDVEHLEVARGPYSVLYGSGAVGGTVQALTPLPAAGEAFGGALYGRYDTAQEASTGHLEARGSVGGRVGLWASASASSFGDLRPGGGGERLPHTGFDRRDAALRLRATLPGSQLVGTFQQHDTDDVWRTHATIFSQPWEGTVAGTDRRRSLDQGRTLLALELRVEQPSWLADDWTVTAALHRHSEEELRIRGNGRASRQGFDVDVWSAAARFHRALGRAVLGYGGEVSRDVVGSFAVDLASDGSIASRGIQGPVADDATYDQAGLYAQLESPLGERLTLLAGGRLSRAAADARAVRDPRSGQRTSLRGSWSAAVGTLRLAARLDRDGRLYGYAGLAQGFRAPNLSDLTRFDIARSGEVETAAPDLSPERTLTAEVGVRATFARAAFDLALFHTELDGLIVRVPTGRRLEDGIEVTKKNAGDGALRGVEISGQLELGRRLRLRGAGTWLSGDLETYPTSAPTVAREPLDRSMPITGHLEARWELPRWWAALVLGTAGRADELSTRDRADTQRIPPLGTPGYAVWSIRGGWSLGSTDRWRLNAAVENLTDRAYRIHGSGQNEPGRGLALTLERKF